MPRETEITRSEKSPFDILAEAYDAWFDGEGRLVFALEVEGFKQILPSLPRPWLEVGVGSGRFAQALGIDAGIDPSEGLIKIANRRGIKTFLGRVEDKFFTEGEFGTVFIILTLCFVDSPEAVLQETKRLLKREGKLVLGMVLRNSPWGQFYLAKKKQEHRFYKHATFYNYDEITGLLATAGFMVQRVVSTLFQKPGEVEEVEEPHSGFSPDAGFTILETQKIA